MKHIILIIASTGFPTFTASETSTIIASAIPMVQVTTLDEISKSQIPVWDISEH